MLRLIWCFWYLLLPAELFLGSIESLEFLSKGTSWKLYCLDLGYIYYACCVHFACVILIVALHACSGCILTHTYLQVCMLPLTITTWRCLVFENIITQHKDYKLHHPCGQEHGITMMVLSKYSRTSFITGCPKTFIQARWISQIRLKQLKHICAS